MAIKREDIQAPALPEEVVPCDALGGDVIVRGLLLSERLVLLDDARNSQRGAEPSNDGTGAVPEADRDFKYVAQMLAIAVLADDRQPLYSAEQWEIFGGKNYLAVIELYNKACALSGIGKATEEALEKN